MSTKIKSVLKNSSKLTNISMAALFSYASVYYLDKTKLLITNPEINTFLDTMKDNFLNSPEEVAAAALTVGGSYLMGSKNEHLRFATFTMWSISNALYGYIAVENNMTPMLAQMAIFQLINFNAMNNILKDEILPKYENQLKNEKLEKGFLSKLKEMKNKAVINGYKRIERNIENAKENIVNLFDTIKKEKEKTVFLLATGVASLLYMNNEKIPEILNTVQNAVMSSPIESIAAGTALVGSYMLSKTGIDTKIQGVSLFLAADILYMNIAYEKDLAPMLIQTGILIGGSLKALDSLYDAKLNSPDLNIEKDKNNLFSNILNKLSSFKETVKARKNEQELEMDISNR